MIYKHNCKCHSLSHVHSLVSSYIRILINYQVLLFSLWKQWNLLTNQKGHVVLDKNRESILLHANVTVVKQGRQSSYSHSLHYNIPLNCHASGVSVTFLPAISRSHAQVNNSHALLQIQCQISPNRPTNRHAVFSRDVRVPLHYRISHNHTVSFEFCSPKIIFRYYIMYMYMSIPPNRPPTVSQMDEDLLDNSQKDE